MCQCVYIILPELVTFVFLNLCQGYQIVNVDGAEFSFRNPVTQSVHILLCVNPKVYPHPHFLLS